MDERYEIGNETEKEYEAKYREMAEFFKAIAHPVRLCILKNILEHQLSGNQLSNVGSIQSCVHIPQSTLSQHLQKLRAAGILIGHRHGIEIAYEIKDRRTMEIIEFMLAQK